MDSRTVSSSDPTADSPPPSYSSSDAPLSLGAWSADKPRPHVPLLKVLGQRLASYKKLIKPKSASHLEPQHPFLFRVVDYGPPMHHPVSAVELGSSPCWPAHVEPPELEALSLPGPQTLPPPPSPDPRLMASPFLGPGAPLDFPTRPSSPTLGAQDVVGDTDCRPVVHRLRLDTSTAALSYKPGSASSSPFTPPRSDSFGCQPFQDALHGAIATQMLQQQYDMSLEDLIEMVTQRAAIYQTPSRSSLGGSRSSPSGWSAGGSSYDRKRSSQNTSFSNSSGNGGHDALDRNNNNNNDDDDDNDNGRKRPRGNETPTSMRTSRTSPRRFACPFRKRNRKRFNVRDHENCARAGFADMATLKRHVSNSHQREDRAAPFLCTRCYSRFPNDVRLQEHMRLPPDLMCSTLTHPPPVEYDPEDGITEHVDALLRHRKQESKISNWTELWRALFPTDMVIPDSDFLAPVITDFAEIEDAAADFQSITARIREKTDRLATAFRRLSLDEYNQAADMGHSISRLQGLPALVETELLHWLHRLKEDITTPGDGGPAVSGRVRFSEPHWEPSSVPGRPVHHESHISPTAPASAQSTASAPRVPGTGGGNFLSAHLGTPTAGPAGPVPILRLPRRSSPSPSPPPPPAVDPLAFANHGAQFSEVHFPEGASLAVPDLIMHHLGDTPDLGGLGPPAFGLDDAEAMRLLSMPDMGPEWSLAGEAILSGALSHHQHGRFPPGGAAFAQTDPGGGGGGGTDYPGLYPDGGLVLPWDVGPGGGDGRA